jgi:DNA-binding NarL/FixJ family response regulator
MKNKIKILLADDELLFRKGIMFLLEREKNFEIIFEASNGQDIIVYLKEQKNHPDIILMDLNMPLLNGVEATKSIRKEFPDIKIIALTSYNTKSFIANMIQVGAVSYLVKNASPKEVVETLNEVYEKGFFYNENVLQVVHEGLLDSKTKSNLDKDFLTSREKEIIRLISQQYSTNQIAEKLFISQRTVEGHRNNLLLKTESKNVAGLLVYALQHQLITLEELSQ